MHALLEARKRQLHRHHLRSAAQELRAGSRTIDLTYSEGTALVQPRRLVGEDVCSAAALVRAGQGSGFVPRRTRRTLGGVYNRAASLGELADRPRSAQIAVERPLNGLLVRSRTL